ncbi:hypothetical protein BBJ28_00015322 [Nothophytophthora sp. Chile5]|nr:hypothetical protein BBJ28_00015322 [Nothophytophthora sp. Chile5]
MFWLRGFFVVFLIAFAVLEQCRYFVPRLPMTNVQLMGSSTFTAVGSVAATYGIACGVGFPLPFTLACGSPACCILLGICIGTFWGKFLKVNVPERNRLIKYMLVVAVQVAMTYVYPAYNSIFVSLESAAQMAFALLLPVLKMAIKNWINFLFRDMDDFKPEVVVLNAEIFHALFVSWCMQRSTTTYTTVLLMTMDFLEATLSLRDVDQILKVMHDTVKTAQQRLTTRGKSPTASDPPRPESPSLMTLAMLIWEKDKEIQKHMSIQRLSQIQCWGSISSGIVHPEEGARSSSTKSVESFGSSANKQHAALSRVKVSAIRLPEGGAISGSTVEDTPRKSRGAPNLESIRQDTIKAISQAHSVTSYALELVSQMNEAERLLYLQHALQILHIVEFLLLIEFTEVVIPVVYCIYLSVVYRLPNRIYYAQLRGVDDARLQRNLLSVVTYSLLELASFLILSYVLQRKVGIPSIRQLAFVLSSQWQVVQCKFVLWVVHSVQAPLDHFGADFSFKFQWLHTNSSMGA